jgi:hypothetical protein
LNAALDVPFSADLYRRFEELHGRVHELVGAQDAAPAPEASQPPSRAATPGGDALPKPKGDAEEALRERAAEPWSGGIRDLLEDASEVRDHEARSIVLDAINALVAAASAQVPAPSVAEESEECADAGPSPEVPTSAGFGDFTWLAAGRLHLGRVADAIQQGSIAAREIADGRPTVKAGSASGAKAADKGGKAAPAKGGKGAPAPVAAEIPESSAASAAILHTIARRSLLDAVCGIVEERERLHAATRRATSLAVVDTLAHRAEELLAVQDREIEALVDPAAGKGKKK